MSVVDLSTWDAAQVAPPIPKGTYDYGVFLHPRPWVAEGGNSKSKWCQIVF